MVQTNEFSGNSAAICPLAWGSLCVSDSSWATCDSWGRDMDSWSCLLSLLLSWFMTWILKLEGGPRLQDGEWGEMKELQPGCLLYSPQAFGNIWHKNKPQKKAPNQNTCIGRWGSKSHLENIQVLMFYRNLIMLADIIDVDSNCKVNLERLSV